MRRFYKTSDGVNIFFSIDTQSVIVNITEKGKYRTDVYGSALEAQQQVDKLAAIRLADGWTELAEGESVPVINNLSDTAIKQLQNLCGSPPNREALRIYLDFLAETDYLAALLDRIIDRIETVKLEGFAWIKCYFVQEDNSAEALIWHISLPGKEIDPKLPKSVSTLLQKTAAMYLSGDDEVPSFHDGMRGNLHALGDDAISEDDCDGISYVSDLCAPIDFSVQSFLLIHPKNGDLCLLEHDGGLSKLEVNYGLAGIFLDALNAKLSFKLDDFPEVMPIAPNYHCVTNQTRWREKSVSGASADNDLLVLGHLFTGGSRNVSVEFFDISEFSDVKRVTEVILPYEIDLSKNHEYQVKFQWLDKLLHIFRLAGHCSIDTDMSLENQQPKKYRGRFECRVLQGGYQYEEKNSRLYVENITKQTKQEQFDRAQWVMDILSSDMQLFVVQRDKLKIYTLNDPSLPKLDTEIIFPIDVYREAELVLDNKIIVARAHFPSPGVIITNLETLTSHIINLASKPHYLCWQKENETLWVSHGTKQQLQISAITGIDSDMPKLSVTKNLTTDQRTCQGIAWMGVRKDELLVVTSYGPLMVFEIKNM